MGVTHIDDVQARDIEKGSRFRASFRRLGGAAGSEDLQCSLYEVPPGKTAFPFHAHYGIEEAIYVLEGTGTLRLGDETHPLRAGSYAAFPT